jgi:hypothetical protein
MRQYVRLKILLTPRIDLYFLWQADDIYISVASARHRSEMASRIDKKRFAGNPARTFDKPKDRLGDVFRGIGPP